MMNLDKKLDMVSKKENYEKKLILQKIENMRK